MFFVMWGPRQKAFSDSKTLVCVCFVELENSLWAEDCIDLSV